MAALGFLQFQPKQPELATLHTWLDTWAGVGLITVGMARQGHDLQLTSYSGQDWRANFYPVGIAHSVVEGSAWEPTAWRAVQRAAWQALNRHAQED